MTKLLRQASENCTYRIPLTLIVCLKSRYCFLFR